MITYMSNLVCITNRKLCRGDFFTQIAKVLALYPKALLLREKDLSEETYLALAAKVLLLCRNAQIPCILHNFPNVAETLRSDGLHLPLAKLEELPESQRKRWKILGASCHTWDDVEKAIKLGATYVTYGHIYTTDCKPGLPGRGLAALQDICHKSPIPVYAIGGISPEKWPELKKAGAAGACLMSWFMRGGGGHFFRNP